MLREFLRCRDKRLTLFNTDRRDFFKVSLSAWFGIVAGAQLSGCGGGGSGGNTVSSEEPAPATNHLAVDLPGEILQDFDGQTLRTLDGKPVELL